MVRRFAQNLWQKSGGTEKTRAEWLALAAHQNTGDDVFDAERISL